jgi:hypothetical protein
MITGAHSIIYSTDPDADRTFFLDVLKLPDVDVGGGWLIFGLPSAEVAVHPADENDRHQFFLMCEDVEAFIAEMRKRNLSCGPIEIQSWGRLTHLTLPGGGKLGVYEPRHARPKAVNAAKKVQKPARRATKKTSKRTVQVARKKKTKGR